MTEQAHTTHRKLHSPTYAHGTIWAQKEKGTADHEACESELLLCWVGGRQGGAGGVHRKREVVWVDDVDADADADADADHWSPQSSAGHQRPAGNPRSGRH